MIKFLIKLIRGNPLDTYILLSNFTNRYYVNNKRDIDILYNKRISEKGLVFSNKKFMNDFVSEDKSLIGKIIPVSIFNLSWRDH